MGDFVTDGGGFDLGEFLSQAQGASRPFLAIIQGLLNASPPFTKHQYATLLNEALAYETFLDDHGARENAAWEYHTEQVASVRNLGIAAFHLRHILDRFERCYLDHLDDDDLRFVEGLESTLEFLNVSLHRLAEEACREASLLGLELPEVEPLPQVGSDARLPGRLPRTGEQIVVEDGDARMLALVRKVRKVFGLTRDFGVHPGLSTDELLEVIPTKLDVKRIQKIKNLLQGVQSDYDTYVSRTALEAEDATLPRLRGTCATSLHLLEALRWLTHFYERHLDPIRQNLIKKRMCELVDKDELLDHAINHLYQDAVAYLEKANRCAEDMLTSYAHVEQVELPLPKPLGFHARPATYVSLIVNEFGTDVYALVGQERYSAKSVMALLEAGWILSEKGSSTVVFEGDERVLKDLQLLADHNYCEDQDIPRQLSYLRILRNR
jgi:phosphotransferase system HPr-like phosphotransfer protein